MSYLYPPPPVIPATLPPNPLGIVGPASNYVVIGTEDTILCFASLTVFLPLSNSASVKSKPYHIKSWGSHVITIVPTSPETIDGATSVILSIPLESRTLIPWITQGWMSV